MSKDKNIYKRVLISSALVLACVFLLGIFAVGCGEDKTEEPVYESTKNCDVVLESETGWKYPYENFITICGSYDEIQEALINHNAEPLNHNDDKVLEYAKEHVEDKSFVVCFYVRTSYNGPHRLREVEVNDGKLTMYIRCSKNTAASDVMRSCTFIAGVDKSFVANVTECEYVFV